MKHLPVADSWVGIVKNKTFFGSEKDAYYDLWQRGARRYDRWPYAKPSVKVFNYLQMDELNDLDQVNDHTVDVIKQKKIVGKKFSTLSRREVLRLASVLKRCGQNNALADGKLVHDHIWRCGYDRNTFLGNWVVQMYGDCGSMAHARAVFDTLPNQNLYSWTILIKGYVKNGCGREALDCFERMQMKAIKPDCKTLTCALDACAILGALDKGHKIHAAIIGSGYEEKLVVATALVNMYGKCANLKAAWSIFSKIPQKDLICWNAMIAACAQHGYGKDALDLYDQMQSDCVSPNYVTYVSVLNACASLRALQKGQEIHAAVIRRGYEGQIVVGTALIHMYGKCKSLKDARDVFHGMVQRDAVLWNAIISACAQNGEAKEALECFSEMQKSGVKSDSVTFACVLDACADLVSLEKGQELHAVVVNSGYERQLLVANALINMYGKCGSLRNARSVFNQMVHRDVVSWNAIIAACAHNGHGKDALIHFNEMESDGIKPDEITFLSVLNACSHTGDVDDGRKYFALMTEDHGIMPKMAHYLCLLDILGRAGHLEDAESLINDMPYKNKASLWLCLLGACRTHGDVERGIRAANHVFKLDPNNPAPYVLLSNIFVEAGRLDDAKKLSSF